MSVRSFFVKASVAAAGAAFAAVGVIGPGVAADALNPVPAEANTRTLARTAVLPDKTVGGFIDAALDGSGSSRPALGAARGAAQDVFEAVVNPGKIVVVSLR